jgi:D-alanyl-D-alanine carboxypeptidase
MQEKMGMRRYLWGVVLALCLAAAPARAGDTALEEKLQHVIEVFLAENGMAPGVSVYAVCPALELDWAGAAGTVARSDPSHLTAAHTFRIASNTKTYVAAAVLRLVEMDRLGLDDSLARYLTAEQDTMLRGDGYDTDAITIAQVLSHTAGLGDHSDDPRFVERIMADSQHVWTRAEKLRCLVEWRDPVGEPGEKYVYSDTGYIILGSIIERISGRALGPAVRDLLGYDELGLEVTYWEYMEDPPAQAGPRAHQYYGAHDVTSWNASFDLYGGGGIVTDARELALFMRMLLKGRVFDRESTLAAMTGRGTLPYRLGLMAVDCSGRVALGHQGFWNTFAFHVPSLDLTIGGSILNHDAANGRELMCRLVAAVAGAVKMRGK